MTACYGPRLRGHQLTRSHVSKRFAKTRTVSQRTKEPATFSRMPTMGTQVSHANTVAVQHLHQWGSLLRDFAFVLLFECLSRMKPLNNVQ